MKTSLQRRKELGVKASLIITSFREPYLQRALQAIHAQSQSLHEVLIVSPDKEAQHLAKKYRHHYIPDPGHGKSAALNLVFPKAKGEIIILTDGDVILEKNAVREIIKPFEDKNIGCVSGRVISANTKDNMFGFWSHLLADAGAHNIRKEGAKKKFLECTGYLFAFRNHVIKTIPTDVAEDALIPYLFKKKGYDITYAEKARVLVKNPTTWKDWITQRKRTAKAHETLEKYVDTKSIQRMKSFSNEIQKGMFWSLSYPRTIREFYWTVMLFIARLYMWFSVFYETKVSKKHYTDKWQRIETAR